MNREKEATSEFRRIFTRNEKDLYDRLGKESGVKVAVLRRISADSVYGQVEGKTIDGLRDFYKRLEEILKQQTNQQK